MKESALLNAPPPARQRDVLRAVAARERARRRLRNTTGSVGLASVVAGGVLALVLPGSTHAHSSDAGPAASGSSAPAGTQPGRPGGTSSASATSGSAAGSASKSGSASSSGSLRSSSPPAASSGSSSAVSGGS